MRLANPAALPTHATTGAAGDTRVAHDFDAFFDAELRPLLFELEGARKQLARRLWIVIASALGVALLLGALLASTGPMALAGALVAALVTAVIGLLIVRPAQREFIARFKRDVVGRVIRFVDPGLAYAPDRGIGESTFRAAGIFRHSIDRYRCEDMVSGRLGATDFCFSEVHAEYETQTTDSKGNRTTHWHTIFRGFFCCADFNKDFQGGTWVLTDTAERLFGGIGRALQGITFGARELVKLEDPEFEREFVVYSTDQQEARYLLSPALMARMLEYKRTARRNVQFSFVDGALFVAVPNNTDLFEPRIFQTNDDPQLLESFYSALQLICLIVEALNLNTRIWTKV